MKRHGGGDLCHFFGKSEEPATLVTLVSVFTEIESFDHHIPCDNFSLPDAPLCSQPKAEALGQRLHEAVQELRSLLPFRWLVLGCVVIPIGVLVHCFKLPKQWIPNGLPF